MAVEHPRDHERTQTAGESLYSALANGYRRQQIRLLKDITPPGVLTLNYQFETHAFRMARMVDSTCSRRPTYMRREPNSTPAYHAISYTWGDAQPTRPIVVDGRTVEIGMNCWFALRQARNFRPGAHLWVDAICINQEDLGEKAHQVGIMGKIYAGASATLACIGNHCDDSEHLWSWLATGFYPLGDAKDARARRLIKAFIALGRRPYWTRMWVVQEVLLSAQVFFMCGDQHVDSYQLFRPFLPANTRAALDAEISGLDASAVSVLAWRDMEKSLILAEFGKVLRYFQDFECSRPIDRIYSVLGITAQLTGRVLQPDYTVSAFGLAVRILHQGCFAVGDAHRDEYWLSGLPNIASLLRTLRVTSEDPEVLEIIRKKAAQVRGPAACGPPKDDFVPFPAGQMLSDTASSLWAKKNTKAYATPIILGPKWPTTITLIPQRQKLGKRSLCTLTSLLSATGPSSAAAARTLHQPVWCITLDLASVVDVLLIFAIAMSPPPGALLDILECPPCGEQPRIPLQIRQSGTQPVTTPLKRLWRRLTRSSTRIASSPPPVILPPATKHSHLNEIRLPGTESKHIDWAVKS